MDWREHGFDMPPAEAEQRYFALLDQLEITA
jgi:hypothetical protein